MGGKNITIEFCSIKQILNLCARGTDNLVHLYWPRREKYFKENILRLRAERNWLLVATHGHGVSGSQRPTINFLAADDKFAQGYESTAEARGFRHGVMFRRSVIEEFANKIGYDFSDVRVGHPKGYGEYASDDFWRFDIGNRRPAAMHELRYATVFRLATPDGTVARHVRIPNESIVALW